MRSTYREKRGKRMAIAWISGLLLLAVVLLLAGALIKSMGSQEDLLPLGSAAPDFEAATNEGNVVHLADLRGKKRVVLVFYPGDDTPVCTAQLCAMRDNWDALQAENAVVLGVNPASRDRHAAFAKRNRLPFPLLVDEDGSLSSRYGCRAIFGIVKRTVYIIDLQGRVAWAKRGNPPPSEVLKALLALKDDLAPALSGRETPPG